MNDLAQDTVLPNALVTSIRRRLTVLITVVEQ